MDNSVQKVGEQREFKMLQLFDNMIYFRLRENGRAKDGSMENSKMIT